MEGSVMAITPLLSSKHESEASSANTCPLTCVLSNGGLVHAHHHPPCCILWPSTPSLARNASWRAVLLPPTLCPAFRVTEGFVHAHCNVLLHHHSSPQLDPLPRYPQPAPRAKLSVCFSASRYVIVPFSPIVITCSIMSLFPSVPLSRASIVHGPIVFS